MQRCSDKEKLLILGSNGLLGSYVSKHLASDFSIYEHSRNPSNTFKADMLKLEEVKRLLNKVQPYTVLNLVALADVDACANVQNAYLGNVKTAENLAESVQTDSSQPYVLHISTDHVYDARQPNSESQVCLTNNYAFSKYASEMAFKGIKASCLRTNFFGKSVAQKKSFSDWIVESLSSGDQIHVFNDVFFNPLSLCTLSKNIAKISSLQPVGIFNLGSREGMSKAEFAFSLAEELGLPTKLLKPKSVNEATFLKEYRPRGMLMNVEKIESLLEQQMPTLRDEIKLVSKEYKGE